MPLPVSWMAISEMFWAENHIVQMVRVPLVGIAWRALLTKLTKTCFTLKGIKKCKGNILSVLPHVSRPIVLAQDFQGRIGNRVDLLLELSAIFLQKKRDEMGNVLTSLPKGWQVNRNDVEAVIRGPFGISLVVPPAPGFVGDGHESCIDTNGLVPPTRSISPSWMARSSLVSLNTYCLFRPRIGCRHDPIRTPHSVAGRLR